MSDESWLIEDEVTKRFLRCWVIAPIFFMVPYVVVSPKYETVEWWQQSSSPFSQHEEQQHVASTSLSSVCVVRDRCSDSLGRATKR